MPDWRDSVVIVSGLPRSGTSMMMGMLEAGGVPVLCDGARAADADNPRGYFEYQPVKRLKEDNTWLPEARGKAVKIVSLLLEHLPPALPCKVVFLERDLPEILASQRRMLLRNGEAPGEDEAALRAIYRKHLEHVRGWLARRAGVETLYVRYQDAIAVPGEVANTVNRFCGNGLDVDAMARAVDAALYRQRR